MFASFLRDERGTTAIEYALIASLMGAAIVGGHERVERRSDLAIRPPLRHAGRGDLKNFQGSASALGVSVVLRM